MGECPDSPGSASPHSNESNTHINNNDQGGYYNTDGEYIDSEYVGDSEFTENDLEEPPELPNYEEILAEQSRLLEDYDVTTHNYNVHPDYYLPLNSSFSSDNNGGEVSREQAWPPAPPPFNGEGSGGSDTTPTSSGDDNDSVLHYGFPPSKCNSDLNRLSMITTDSDLNVDTSNRLSGAFTTDSEFNGDYNRASTVDDMSDISGLCEIEDSEVNLSESEDENTPLQTVRRHTEV